MGTNATDGPLENRWLRGAAGGLAAALLTGAVLMLNTPEVLRTAIPALYGVGGLAVGWLVHLVHGALAGLLYVAAVEDVFGDVADLGARAATPDSGAPLGLAYGLVLWLVVAVVLVPVALGATGAAGAPAVPFVDVQALLAYLLFGTVIGAVYGGLSAA